MNTEPIGKYAELEAAIAALPLEYRAEFVPQRFSRNAGDKNPSLNWRVILTAKAPHKAPPMVTDYMQGIGHMPGYSQRNNLAQSQDRALAAQYGTTGWRNGKRSVYLSRPIPAPLLRDVLYSLVLDAGVINAGSFENWASDYGYDTDSRKAEETYNQCLTIGRQLRALIGAKAMAELETIFQDY